MSANSSDIPAPYTPSVPRPAPDRAALRARIPGWGVDLDPADRPSGTVETIDEAAADRGMPPRQADDPGRERSIEHAFLTPVYGTAQPLHGLSGRIRRLAYARFSEGRAAHWLLLIAGDRVEAVGAHVRSLATARPDNPITETGILSEARRHPIRSRFGRGRVDRRHTWLDPLLVAGPWVLAGWVVIRIVGRALARR